VHTVSYGMYFFKRKILTIMLHSDTILLRVSEGIRLFYAEVLLFSQHIMTSMRRFFSEWLITHVVASGISRFESFQLLFAGTLKDSVCIIHTVTLQDYLKRDC
jgi:hypothetical protein